jgi:DNA-3-methyladenine glycosylase
VPKDAYPGNKKLQRSFYHSGVLTVARNLLGKLFVVNRNGSLLTGRIVEVEAYDQEHDLAAHSYNGRTARNEVMFKEGGHLYVYFTYGIHFCANVVAGEAGRGCGALLRGIELINGIDVMKINRFGNSALKKPDTELTNGPAKICRAFGIYKEQNGTDLTGDSIYLLDAPPVEESMVIKSTRIGIKKSVDLLWRFYIKDNSFVSRL